MARRYIEEQHLKNCGIKRREGPSHYKGVQVLSEVPLDSYLGGVFCLQYNHDGTRVCAGFGGGGIKMYDAKTGKMVRQLRENRHGGYAIMCMHYHPTNPNLLYAGTAEGHVYLMNAEDDPAKADFQHIITEPKNQINTLDFSADGFNFCTCGKDLTVRVYSKDHKLVREYLGYGDNIRPDDPKLEAGNTMRVFSLKFHPQNDSIFLTAGWDNHIKIWDLRHNDGILRHIRGPHVCGDSMDFKNAEGRTILTGSWCANHALQEWDYSTGKMVRDIKYPQKDGSFLYCAQYADEGTVIAGGSGTNSADIIDINTPDDAVIGHIPLGGPVQSVDSAMNGEVFAVGGGDNKIFLCGMKN